MKYFLIYYIVGLFGVLYHVHSKYVEIDAVELTGALLIFWVLGPFLLFSHLLLKIMNVIMDKL
jgi:hypothetical protein